MVVRRACAAALVATALATGVGVAAPTATAAPTGSADSGSATYARDFVQLIVCLFRGELVGSKAPLC
ncbi:hypothetical protein GV791_13740 [Nocardia cyriacigeorgica]|uniref:Secreted protein n=2 Tax=Nocardia cyriacigeorgica TaxID=135487 RepID=H6QYE4_NOCCG|nr:hypothetical protein [Nocardia cyriacigeorgica]MBF6286326.1 hypothetical protein [Nocardia cyriacigeorgica]MBF6423249.1 hypothetical protein [Nocardia cyriacigeorgica]NEW33618.1 hypothetical protein [Nocardia cyriacigeorgica]CCF63994.1 conserved exported protein of unknown function [Nocardia cyriacigeorgica GUH-2]BDT87646.1 hypothetical protein FMUAM8_34100 [Nocardia cyriacigeorgica]